MSILVAGCGATTPYQELGFVGTGVRATPVAENRFKIESFGNAASDVEVIKKHAVRKAAETTSEAGGTHFVVTQSGMQSKKVFRVVNGKRESSGTKPQFAILIDTYNVAPGAPVPPNAYVVGDILKQAQSDDASKRAADQKREAEEKAAKNPLLQQ